MLAECQSSIRLVGLVDVRRWHVALLKSRRTTSLLFTWNFFPGKRKLARILTIRMAVNSRQERAIG